MGGICAAMTTLLMTAAAGEGLPRDAADWPLLVGGHAHGAENIRTLAELGVGNFVWIPAPGYVMGNTPWDAEHDIFADVAACIEAGLHFMPSQRRGLGDTVRPGGFTYGGHGSGEMRPIEELAAVRERGGALFVGVHGEEMDIDLIQESVRPSFLMRVPELWQYSDRTGGRLSFEGELRRLTERYHALGVPFLPNLCVTHQHCGYRAGADMALGELFEHLPTTELQLAYLRGASRQFGRPFGVWISPWFWGQAPTEDKSLWPAHQAQPGGGHTLDRFRRALYLSFISGARLITMQETEPLFSRSADGGYELAAWGRELRAFWEYARDRDAPMDPITPLAVLIDVDNGWEPAHLCQDWNPHESVWGKLPIDRRADGMLRAYLDLLLPGFMRTPESVRAREDIYPGYFAATPAGPFDVLTSDADASTLAAYPALVLLGHVEMTQELMERLRAYVAQGGALVLNACDMRCREAVVQDEALLGARIGSYTSASDAIRVTEPLPGIDQRTYDEPWFAAVEVTVTTGETVAETDEGRPALVRNRFGEGVAYLMTPEYMMDGWGEQDNRLAFCEDFVRSLTAAASPRVEGGRDISWTAALQGETIYVALANHGDASQTADLHLPVDVAAALDFGEGAVDHAGEGLFRVTVGPRDVVVVRGRPTEP